ncbi:MAG: hypothetical protein R3Y19_03030 [Rikenellaceae bacterium]
MKIRRLIISLFLTFATSLGASANDLFVEPPKQVVATSDDFTLSRSVVISSSHDALRENQQLCEFVRSAGGEIEQNFFKKFKSPKILIKRRSRIKDAQGDNGLQIVVGANKIQIFYTTEASLDRAMELLEEKIIDRNGRLLVSGGTITDWVEASDRAPSVSGTLDLTRGGILSYSQLSSSIGGGRSRGTTQRLKVVSSSAWVIESHSLDDINPTQKIYSQSKYYTLDELSKLNHHAVSRNTQLSLEVELLSSNSQFKRVTGFEFNSVEGMRFVRQLLGEWSVGTGIRNFVISGGNFKDDPRFGEFLQHMKTVLNINITIE